MAVEEESGLKSEIENEGRKEMLENEIKQKVEEGADDTDLFKILSGEKDKIE